jgi:HSF-type DNA-binding
MGAQRHFSLVRDQSGMSYKPNQVWRPVSKRLTLSNLEKRDRFRDVLAWKKGIIANSMANDQYRSTLINSSISQNNVGHQMESIPKDPPQNLDPRCSSTSATAASTSSTTNNSDMCTTGTRRRLRRNRGGSESQFPGKLYDLLEYVAENDLESVISWARNGTAIMIHDPDKLVEILPKFFGQTKYRSFRRQLNMWHFHRIMEGPHRGAFVHPCFIRGNKQLITYMSRHVHAAAASPTAPSPTDFPSPVPGRSYEDWQSHPLQHPQLHPPHGAPMINHFLQQRRYPPSLDTNATSNTTAYDNVLLSSLDPQMSSMDFSYNIAPLPTTIADRADERIQFEPSAIFLTESPVLSSSTKFQGFSMDHHFTDGDPISFAGRRFHYVDYNSPQNKKAIPLSPPLNKKSASASQRGTSSNPSHREEHVGMHALDAFADDAPMIVADELLEPLSAEVIDTIFSMTDDDYSKQL